MTTHGPSQQEIDAFGGDNPHGTLMVEVSPDAAVPHVLQADPSNTPQHPDIQIAPVAIVGNQIPTATAVLAPEATPAADQGQQTPTPRLRTALSRGFQYGAATARARRGRGARKKVTTSGSARRQGSPATSAPAATTQTHAPASSPNQQPAIQTPNVAPNPSSRTTEADPVKADWEVRRDLFMELESACDEYINATIASRVGSTKKDQKRFEAATEKYTAVRDKAIGLHAEDMLSTGKTADEVKQSITQLFITDTLENERLISIGMIDKANEAQAVIDAAENPNLTTKEGRKEANKERFYKLWTEGTGEKLLSRAGFKNRFTRSAITTAVTFAPGVAIGAVAATLAAPLVGLAGAGALTIGAGAAARGALRAGVNEFINRRAEAWGQNSAAHPTVTNAEVERENIVNGNLQMATAYNSGSIGELTTDLLIQQDRNRTKELLEEARGKERQKNKALRRKIAFFAGSSVLGVTVGGVIRWAADEGIDRVTQFIQDREFRLPFNHGNELPSLRSSSPSTTEAVTPTTDATTPTAPTTSAPSSTVPGSVPTPETPPVTPVPGELPGPATMPDIDTGKLHEAITLGRLQAIDADPVAKAAFDRMVSNPYEFGTLQNAVTELQVQNPGMSQTQIEQLTQENLDRAHQHQIGQYLLGMKALEDESGLKVGTSEFDSYAAGKINQISDAEFAPMKTIVDERINGSSLDTVQQTSMHGYANADSVNGYQNGYAAMNQTIADGQRVGLTPPEIKHALVQNMTAVKGEQVNALLDGNDEDDVADMLMTYYGLTIAA